ncbi:putative beta-lysine N-acetyltransferase [Metabacillus bambusae]|uniref:Beta-lysine N-acetyltransferase n=1 Tax=Metabacillus bambusae TaxID=2795218 RepID=A0ABS3N5Y8_9BACI|nr:putative beta-lysine N-acetyltransferase [Metabacillus bambusae]MBO1513707.1 putative beta-lysine N-acetyltransferase [Metabacillus bambusae]
MKPAYETKNIKTSDYSVQFYLDYFNERLRVDNYRGNMSMILQELNEILDKNSFTKVIFFSRPEHWLQLLAKGFELEAIIKGFFNGTDNYVMTCYKEIERRTNKYWIQEDTILQRVLEKEQKQIKASIPDHYHFRKATSLDAKKLAELYAMVFKIYPTPMSDPEYVKRMIEAGTIFYIVECNKQIVSSASADINQLFHHAELTDCATLPEHRKYGLMKKLLIHLEADLKNRGIFCAFSIARALSFGMNAAFYQLGYQYNGRLTNNCYIFDKLEDMNVWVKDLSSEVKKI